MGGYAGANVKVYLDNRRVKVSGFKDYMSMYEGMETPVIFESIGDCWEVGGGGGGGAALYNWFCRAIRLLHETVLQFILFSPLPVYTKYLSLPPSLSLCLAYFVVVAQEFKITT